MDIDSQNSSYLDLASLLVRISRECDVSLENLRAEQLVRESQAAWPGPRHRQWAKWLREACVSLSLRCRVTMLDTAQALDLARDGAVLIGGYQEERGALVLLADAAGRPELAVGDLDSRQRVDRAELDQHLQMPDQATPSSLWLVVEHPAVYNSEHARHLHGRPLERLMQIIHPEWSDIRLILVFAFVAGVFSLATPIAVESLVDTVAFGRVLQPVFILAALLFGFLVFAGIMQALQTFVAEIIQRRLFARVTADLAYRLPRIDKTEWGGAYGPELVNRFMDVVTLQKVVASLLLDGVAVVLATLVGMTVLAFYHPWLLGFDVVLLLLIVTGVYLLGRGAVNTAIDESIVKYRLVAWLEDVVRCEEGFKIEGGADFSVDRANLLAANYLSARESHFRILFRQIIYILALQAVAGTVLLGGGGWLVIQGQLSLGQLVAAELIVTMILASLAKLCSYVEKFYDLVAAVDKLGILFDLDVEPNEGLLEMSTDNGIEVQFTKLRCDVGNSILGSGLTERVAAGERVAVFGPAASGKSKLLRILYGLEVPGGGHVEIGESDPRELRPDVLRSHVALVGEVELFEGSIAENVHLRRAGLTSAEARAALDQVGLLESFLHLPDSLETRINASGEPLSKTQKNLLMLARAIAGEPELLLIDGVLDHLSDESLAMVLPVLLDKRRNWTVIVATGRQLIARRFERTIDLTTAEPIGEEVR